MTRHRKGLRPLSQTGLHRLPHNAKQRVAEDGGTKKRWGVLDAFNEREEHRQLHPTKGWRELNVKRARAQALVAAIRSGQRLTLAGMGRFIRTGKTNEGLL